MKGETVTLLIMLGLAAVGLIVIGGVWTAVKVRKYRTETEQRRARAFAGMAKAVEEARRGEGQAASGD